MSKLLKRGVIYIIIVILPILSIDYYVDSYASFRVTYLKIGKTSIESNYCVGTDIPLSERKAKWAALIYMQPVEHMILGSSRSMLFSKENLALQSFYNLGVSGGSSVRDYMAEVYILYRLNKLPQNMLIEVSPSIFNANSGEYRWSEWGKSCEYMSDLLSGGDIRADDSHLLGIQIKDILSPAYFKYNLDQYKLGRRTCYFINEFEDNELLATQHVDGSYAYSQAYQVKNDEEAVMEQIMNECSSGSIYCCYDFTELDGNLIEDFQHLISFLEEQGVNVALYLPPYAEYMYEFICGSGQYASILKVEEYILKYGRDNQIQVYGSYNPEEIGLEMSDMYDAYHIKEDRVRDTLWVRNPEAGNMWLW